MDRVKRFQRTLLITLTGINILVYSISQSFPFGKAMLFSILGMIGMFSFIYSYATLKRMGNPKRIPTKE